MGVNPKQVHTGPPATNNCLQRVNSILAVNSALNDMLLSVVAMDSSTAHSNQYSTRYTPEFAHWCSRALKSETAKRGATERVGRSFAVKV